MSDSKKKMTPAERSAAWRAKMTPEELSARRKAWVESTKAAKERSLHGLRILRGEDCKGAPWE